MTTATSSTSALPDHVDVVVVGGGAAGLAAALALGRSRRSVVVIDDGTPRNAPAAHMHAFLTRDGTPPLELLQLGRAEVAGYGVHLHDGRVTATERTDDRFEVQVDDGTRVGARQLIVTTGLTDVLPDIPGLAQRWGNDVVHCPYCHGWEVRDRRIGVLATTPMALHAASLFRQLTDDLVVLTHTQVFEPEDTVGLRARGVEFIDGEVTSIDVDDDAITGVTLADGTTVDLEVVAAGSRMEARADLLEALGLQVEEHPSGMGSFVPSEMAGRTSVEGVWVAGNVTDPSAQVIAAAAQGNMTGAMVNMELAHADERQALAATR